MKKCFFLSSVNMKGSSLARTSYSIASPPGSIRLFVAAGWSLGAWLAAVYVEPPLTAMLSGELIRTIKMPESNWLINGAIKSFFCT